jgi:hypothetical protein
MSHDLLVPTDLMRQHPDQAEVVLQTGALANALLSIGRGIQEGPISTGVQQYDRLQAALLGAGYICELVIVLSRRHRLGSRLARIGMNYAQGLVQLDDLSVLLDSTSTFAHQCNHIRDKCAFHKDPNAFRDYLAGVQGTAILVRRVEGQHVEDTVFVAARDALAAVPELCDPSFVGNFKEVFRCILDLGDAVAAGFLVSHGFAPAMVGTTRR